jgi:thiol peroxidase
LSRNINFKGRQVTLVGRRLKTDTTAPGFTLVSEDMSKVFLSGFNKKIKILTSFLSVDTTTCGFQVKEFEKRTLNMPQDAVVIGISRDLPFAQKKFCLENGINHVKILSDYRYSSFGINYGLLIKELNLLARAIIIIDKNNNIRYFHILEEASHLPNFDLWFNSLEEVIKNPSMPPEKNASYQCVPCEAGTLPMDRKLIEKYLKEVNNWQFNDNRISKTFKFKDFVEAKYFVDLLSIIAEEQGHHPDLKLWYNKLQVELTTHAIGGLSENDFVMAKIIDEL